MPEITKDEILNRIINKLTPQVNSSADKPKLIKMLEMMASKNSMPQPLQSPAPMPQAPMNLPIAKPQGQIQSGAPIPQTPPEKPYKLPRMPLSQRYPYGG